MRDFDRRLTTRGRRDASLMAELIAKNPPEAILCSPAKRTRETLAAVTDLVTDAPHAIFAEGLYTEGHDYRDLIAEHGGDAERLLVVGHNPTIHRTALSLTGSGDAALHAMMSGKYPTAALAVLAFDVPAWRELKAGGGELISFQRPRDLGAFDADD
jgi:phosphohistidine phosphatase